MKTKVILRSVVSFTLILIAFTSKSQNTFPASGNVGIGVSPAAYPLDVNGTGQFAGGAKIGNGPIGFYGDGVNHAVRAFNTTNNGGFWVQSYNGNNTYMYVGQTGSYTGNIGIGTITPSAKLSFGTNSVGSPAIHLYDGGAAGGRFGMGIQNAEMQMFVGGNAHFSWNSGGDLQASGTNELMRLTTGGLLGIGTTNPQGALDVNGLNAAAWIYFHGNANGVINPSSSMNSGLMTSWNPSGGQGETQILYGTGAGTVPRLDIGRWTGSTKTIDMTFLNGSIGIGTNPGEKLDVNGLIFSRSLSGQAGFRIYNGGATAEWIMQQKSSTDHKFYISKVVSGVQSDYFNIDINGNVGIGTTNPGTMKLAVEGNIGARKIIVTQAVPFPDYVFKKEYKLRSLTDLETFIKKYNHLPDVPSAKIVEKDGLDIGSIQAALLRKIEELTLYVIALNKEIEILKVKK